MVARIADFNRFLFSSWRQFGFVTIVSKYFNFATILFLRRGVDSPDPTPKLEEQPLSAVFDGLFGIRECIHKFPYWVVTKYALTTINTRRVATQRVMAAKLIRPTHKIAIQLHLVTESCTICSSRSRWPVRKLLDTPSYTSCTWRPSPPSGTCHCALQL
jgi:hypothetical protein